MEENERTMRIAAKRREIKQLQANEDAWRHERNRCMNEWKRAKKLLTNAKLQLLEIAEGKN